MTNTIYSDSRYLMVAKQSGPYVSKSYISNARMTGDVMYDIDTQQLKVFDGESWQSLAGNAYSVSLDAEAVSLLDWARDKRNEESERARLSKTYAAVRDLMDQIKEKEDQLKAIQTLIKEEVKVETN